MCSPSHWQCLKKFCICDYLNRRWVKNITVGSHVEIHYLAIESLSTPLHLLKIQAAKAVVMEVEIAEVGLGVVQRDHRATELRYADYADCLILASRLYRFYSTMSPKMT